ncbi:FkbM family methyltransferase [Flavobacterium flavipallidum]|uniref:FkbM family methyltransferase n=1 Tax=Flavobacterium flavipallidum TaxID=3139140 RepID=A0ABU9HJ53_9FLAO
MIKWGYNIIKNITKNFYLAKGANYNFKDKTLIFKILNLLYLKSVFGKNENEVSQEIFGFKVTAYSYNTIILLFKEIFITNDYFFQSDNQTPKIIDCGANIGMSILYFKFRYPNCSIVAFEPNPRAFDLLKKNIEQNKLDKIELYNLALSDTTEEIDFYTGNDNEILLASTLKERGGQNNIKIQAHKLSSYLNDTVDLIKVDIEGSENQLLIDLVSSGKINNSKKYIIEYHHKINNKKSSFSTFIKPFEDSGFEYNIKTSFPKIGAFQDVLLYIYK